MSPSKNTFSFCLIFTTLHHHLALSHPPLNPHINQTSNGSWTITAYKIAVESVWFQDDLHSLLYLTAGNYNNLYYMDAFYFNDSSFIEIVKTNASGNMNHKYNCEYSTECGYNCEVNGYNESYLQYSGQYKQLSQQFENDSAIYTFIGPALDALDMLPVVVYASNASDNTNVLMYRGMDLLMQFGGLGRYYFPGNLYNQPPNYNVMQNLIRTIGCPHFDDIVTNFENKYDQPESHIDQYISMIGNGSYFDERNEIYGTSYYYINSKEQIITLIIDGKNDNEKEYYRSYSYNNSIGQICYDRNNINCTYVYKNYTEMVNNLNGYPTDIAYNGKYLVLEQEFVDDINDLELDIFSGFVIYFDGIARPIIKYFDAKTHLLIGMDVIKEGTQRNEAYDYTKTGYQRVWFHNTTAPN